MQIRFKKKKKKKRDVCRFAKFQQESHSHPTPPAHLSQPQTGAVRVPHARKALHQQAASVGYSPIAFKGGRAASGAQPARAGGMGAAGAPLGLGVSPLCYHMPWEPPFP